MKLLELSLETVKNVKPSKFYLTREACEFSYNKRICPFCSNCVCSRRIEDNVIAKGKWSMSCNHCEIIFNFECFPDHHYVYTEKNENAKIKS